MNEGKKLLYEVINDRLYNLSHLDTSSLFTDGINIKELYELLEEDDINFTLVTDEILDRVIGDKSQKNAERIRKNITNACDLLLGKKDYNLKVTLTQEHQDALNTFKKKLGKIISTIPKEVINKEENVKRIKELKKCLDNNYLINDFELIENITNEYDVLNYDKNMVIIMKYVNDFNLNLLKLQKKNSPFFDIQMIRKSKLDSRLKEMLKKLEIKQKDIPNYLLSELKKADADKVIDNFNIIRRNKAENGGILHFIEKDNIIYLLAILLYASPISIRDVILNCEDEGGHLDIDLLKIIINKVPTCLLEKKNTYFSAKHEDFKKNMDTLKKLGINYTVLVKRCPLFIIIDNDALDYTLDYLSRNGASKRDIINRCYKTLAIKMPLLIDNLEIMRKYNIDLKAFFTNNNNFNLLKMVNLESKLLYLRDDLDVDIKDISILNKIIISKVYHEASAGYINWGEK